MELTSCVLVTVKTDTLMHVATLEQLKKWIQIRLHVDNVEIDNTLTEEYKTDAEVQPL